MNNMSGRLDDSFIDEHREQMAREDHRRRVFIANLKSLARTQKTLAPQYERWAMEGGPQAEYYAKEAERLNAESQQNMERVRKELQDGQDH